MSETAHFKTTVDMKLTKDLVGKIKTGVAAIILHEGNVLIGKRKKEGVWAFPGGHIEFYDESLEACAKREVFEETGLQISCINLDGVGPDLFTTFDKIGYDKYITLYLLAKLEGGILENKEPDKCEEWKWVNLADVPNNDTWIPVERIKANINRNGC